MCEILQNSKTCHKYGNEEYSFHYGKSLTDHIIVAEPILENMLEKLKKPVVHKKKTMLEKFKT